MNNLLYVVKQQPNQNTLITTTIISEAINIFNKNDIDFILINEINDNNVSGIKLLIHEFMNNKPKNKIFGIIVKEFNSLISNSAQQAIENRCSFIISNLTDLENITNKFF